MTLQSFLSKIHFRASAMPKFLAAAAMLSLSLSAHAANIVADSGFESAGGGNEYFAGQSIDGGSWNVVTGSVFIDNTTTSNPDPYVYAGSNSLNLTGVNPGGFNSISQTLSTVAGTTYVLNFWANSDSNNLFSILINGTPLAGSPSMIIDNGFPNSTNNTSLFQDYSDVFTATSSTTSLTFEDTSTPDPLSTQTGSVMIDNVSVQMTPEPGSIVLLSSGILGLGLLAMRKRLIQPSIAG
jgi:hypothetical protein